MKKELLLRKHVIQEVCLSALEIEPQVKDEVYVIEEKSKYAASAVQFILNEMNRLVDYSKSRYGKTYIQRHFPKFEDDKDLALDIADFYWVLLALESKGQSDIDEKEEDELIGGITAEIDDFFRSFFLERHLRESAEAMKGSAVNPLVLKASDWLIYQFRTKERLSFFLDRCEHKGNARIARELRAAVKARFLRITDKDDNDLKEAMRKSLTGLLDGIAETQQKWHSVITGTAGNDEVARLAKEYEEFMKSEAV